MGVGSDGVGEGVTVGSGDGVGASPYSRITDNLL